MGKLKLLWRFMKGSRLRYTGAVMSIGLAALFSFLSPLVIRYTIDTVIGGGNTQLPVVLQGLAEGLSREGGLIRRLLACSSLLLLLALSAGLFTFFKGKWSAEASEFTAKRIREQLYDHLQNVSYDYHVKAETGDLLQRCTSDVDTIRAFLAEQLVEVGRAVIMLTLALSIMLSLNLKMTMVAMAVVPVIFSFAVIFFLKVKNAFKASDESEGRLSATLQENLTGVRVVRAFARQQHEILKFEERNAEYRDLTYRLILLLAAYWSISDLLCMLQVCAVLVFGVYWTTTGVITLGTLVVFTTYEGMLLWPIRQMGRILTGMGKTVVSLERIGEILAVPLETGEQEGLKPQIEGDIEFRNVSFAYEEGKQVLRSISFRAKPGQTVALLGPTGSGKSTLVHLLARLYDCQSGIVSIDGTDVRDIDKKWLRQNVGIVLQEPFLFSKTLKENIRLPKPQAGEEEIFAAARIASIHDVALGFEKGYETLVGEKGVTLSGGQKQRVAIARTLIKDCPVLIFDDSLSAVDTETDTAIRKALKERNKQATTFIISHRITTLSEADVILVLENGEIVQQGSHRELVSQAGLYQRIWQIQNELEKEVETDMEMEQDRGENVS